MGTADILAEVDAERVRQEELRRAGKFAWTCADPTQPNVRKLAVLSEEFGEAAQEVVEEMTALDKGRTREDRTWDQGAAQHGHAARRRLRTELIQVAAVAVAWVESLEGDK